MILCKVEIFLRLSQIIKHLWKLCSSKTLNRKNRNSTFNFHRVCIISYCHRTEKFFNLNGNGISCFPKKFRKVLRFHQIEKFFSTKVDHNYTNTIKIKNFSTSLTKKN
jgi:hypothetical protein